MKGDEDVQKPMLLAVCNDPTERICSNSNENNRTIPNTPGTNRIVKSIFKYGSTNIFVLFNFFYLKNN